MKILHTVEFYNPSVGGAQEVVKQLSEHLVLLGHDVTVATTKLSSRKNLSINGVKIVEFDVSGNEVRGYSGEDVEKYKNFLVNGKFDAIMNYAAQQWTADLSFEVLDKIEAKKIFVPCGYSGLYNQLYKGYFTKLPEILRKYDKCVYLSSDYRDIDFARKFKLKNSVIIPNGADEREFGDLPVIDRQLFLKKYGIPINNKLILCVSNHTSQKGHREAIETFRLSKIKNVSLVFIGDTNLQSGCYKQCIRSGKITNLLNLFSKLGKTIHILDVDRAETIKFFSVSDIFIFLSNLECSPLVLFETAAAGKPFIASSCGNANEIAKWTKSGVIVPSTQKKDGQTNSNIASSSKILTKLINNHKLLEEMGAKGRSNWLKKYTWSKISKQYELLYK